MDLVIMAAGKGTRLYPITEETPKPMVKIHGKPIIDWIFESIEGLQFREIFLILGHKREVIKEHLKDKKGITYIYQENQTGTADAISLVEDMVDKNFMVLPGDTIYLKKDLQNLYNTTNSLLYGHWGENLCEFGTLKIDFRNQIEYISEKKKNPISKMVNLSAYNFTNDIFQYMPFTELVKGEKVITNTINEFISDNGVFKGVYTEKWYQVTYPQDIKEIESIWNGKIS